MTREEFEREYNEKVGDILNAAETMHPLRVKAWLDLIDNVPAVSGYVNEIEGRIDFDAWYHRATGQMGGPQLAELFSPEKEARTAQFLGLMRQFTQPRGWHRFGLTHFRVTNGAAAALDMVNRNVVGPFARDLLKDLAPRVRDAEKKPIQPEEAVATIDPMSPAIIELNEKIDELITLLRTSNSAAELLGDDKDRLSAELSASKVLIRVSRVDRSLMSRLLTPAFKFIARTLADQAGEAAVKAALALLAAHFGITIAV